MKEYRVSVYNSRGFEQTISQMSDKVKGHYVVVPLTKADAIRIGKEQTNIGKVAKVHEYSGQHRYLIWDTMKGNQRIEDD
jgi:hypothetical protein